MNVVHLKSSKTCVPTCNLRPSCPREEHTHTSVMLQRHGQALRLEAVVHCEGQHSPFKRHVSRVRHSRRYNSIISSTAVGALTSIWRPGSKSYLVCPHQHHHHTFSTDGFLFSPPKFDRFRFFSVIFLSSYVSRVPISRC